MQKIVGGVQDLAWVWFMLREWVRKVTFLTTVAMLLMSKDDAVRRAWSMRTEQGDVDRRASA